MVKYGNLRFRLMETSLENLPMVIQQPSLLTEILLDLKAPKDLKAMMVLREILVQLVMQPFQDILRQIIV